MERAFFAILLAITAYPTAALSITPEPNSARAAVRNCSNGGEYLRRNGADERQISAYISDCKQRERKWEQAIRGEDAKTPPPQTKNTGQGFLCDEALRRYLRDKKVMDPRQKNAAIASCQRQRRQLTAKRNCALRSVFDSKAGKFRVLRVCLSR